MISSSEDNDSHKIAPSNERCVWMTAGILSYQLCDRQFDCDQCPLDAAMRMHFWNEPHNNPTTDEQQKNSSSSTLQGSLLYSKNHCWIYAHDEETIRIGIEPQLASLLLSPKAIVLPFVGDIVKHGTACCWIVTAGGTFPILSPVSGIVTATNNLLHENPYELRANPTERGWLFDAHWQGKASEQSMLMNKQRAEKIYPEDSARFDSLVKNAVTTDRKSVGVTLPDGGQVLTDYAAILGPRRYLELIRNVFGGH